jgi:hypothetical protein
MTSDTVKLAYLTDRSGFDCIVFAFKSTQNNPDTGTITFTDVLAIQAEFDEEKETLNFKGFSTFSYWSRDLEVTIPERFISTTVTLNPQMTVIYHEALVTLKASWEEKAAPDSPVRKILKMERPKS